MGSTDERSTLKRPKKPQKTDPQRNTSLLFIEFPHKKAGTPESWAPLTPVPSEQLYHWCKPTGPGRRCRHPWHLEHTQASTHGKVAKWSTQWFIWYTAMLNGHIQFLSIISFFLLFSWLLYIITGRGHLERKEQKEEISTACLYLTPN